MSSRVSQEHLLIPAAIPVIESFPTGMDAYSEPLTTELEKTVAQCQWAAACASAALEYGLRSR